MMLAHLTQLDDGFSNCTLKDLLALRVRLARGEEVLGNQEERLGATALLYLHILYVTPTDPSIQMIPISGPKVCKYYLHWFFCPQGKGTTRREQASREGRKFVVSFEVGCC